MNRIWKIGAMMALAFFAFAKSHAQATKTIAIDSINVLDPVLMGGITHFRVKVRVTNSSLLPDSIFGDIHYYYLTDSMFLASAPPRVFLLDTVNEMVVDETIDTIPIDIQPNELRTTPVNLIILWPGVIGSEITDSIRDSIWVYVDGFLDIPTLPPTKHTVIFPCPALQYIYIRQEEIGLIQQINILSMEGKLIDQYSSQEFNSGFINLDHLANGNYLVELNYYTHEIIRTKILKR